MQSREGILQTPQLFALASPLSCELMHASIGMLACQQSGKPAPTAQVCSGSSKPALFSNAIEDN